MGAAELARLNAGLREKLPVESDGRLILKARANAVRGTVPGKRRA
jgi:hypothetical protein